MITVLLLNYKRTSNVLQILDRLRAQTIPCEIFLWNNSDEPFEDDRVDWVINSGRNAVCWPRWFMAPYASNELVMTWDDDLNFEDNDVLEILHREANAHYQPGRIFGLYGVQVNNPEVYFPSQNDKRLASIGLKKVNKSIGLPKDHTPVDLVKGRCMVLHKQDLKAVPITTDFGLAYDDIAVSRFVAGEKKLHHLIVGGLKGKISNFDDKDGEMALSSKENWAESRSKALNYFFGSKK